MIENRQILNTKLQELTAEVKSMKDNEIKFGKDGEITVKINPSILTDAWLRRKSGQSIDQRVTELITKGLEAEKAEEDKQLNEQFSQK